MNMLVSGRCPPLPILRMLLNYHFLGEESNITYLATISGGLTAKSQLLNETSLCRVVS